MKPSEKHADKIHYEKVAEELQSGNTDRGLMAKAIVHCRGNKQEADLVYVEWRVETLKEEQVEQIKAEADLKEAENVKRLKREADLKEVANEKARAELKRRRRNDLTWHIKNILIYFGIAILFLIILYFFGKLNWDEG